MTQFGRELLNKLEGTSGAMRQQELFAFARQLKAGSFPRGTIGRPEFERLALLLTNAGFHDALRQLEEASGPAPPLVAGETYILVALAAGRGATGRVKLTQCQHDGPPLPALRFDEFAQRAAETAYEALGRWLARLTPCAYPPATWQGSHRADWATGWDPQTRIMGASLGAPLAMAMLSSWLDRPVPPHIAMTGIIGATSEGGRLLPVDGIRAKVEALQEDHPKVTHLVVPEGNLGEAKAIFRGKTSGVSDLAELIRVCGLLPTQRELRRRPTAGAWPEQVVDRRVVEETAHRIPGFADRYVDPGPLRAELIGTIELATDPRKQTGTYVLVTGAAGTGKSFLLEGLEREPPKSLDVLRYRVRPGAPSSLPVFVETLVQRIGAHVRLGRSLVPPPAVNTTDVSRLRKELHEWLSRLMRHSSVSTLVLVIDGLDELSPPTPGTPDLTACLPEPHNLPTGCAIVLGCRESELRSDVSAQIARLQANRFVIDERAGFYVDALKRYLGTRGLPTSVHDEILRAGASRWLWVAHLADTWNAEGLRDGVLAIGNEVYPQSIGRLATRLGERFARHEGPLLAALACIGEPMDVGIIRHILPRVDVEGGLDQLAGFLVAESQPSGQRAYNIRHTTLAQWIQSEPTWSPLVSSARVAFLEWLLETGHGTDFAHPVVRGGIVRLPDHLRLAPSIDDRLDALLARIPAWARSLDAWIEEQDRRGAQWKYLRPLLDACCEALRWAVEEKGHRDLLATYLDLRHRRTAFLLDKPDSGPEIDALIRLRAPLTRGDAEQSKRLLRTRHNRAVYLAEHDLQAALDEARGVVEERRALVTAGHFDVRPFLGDSMMVVAKILADMGNLRAALREAESALSLREESIAEDVRDGLGRLLECVQLQCELRLELGQLGSAQRCASRACKSHHDLALALGSGSQARELLAAIRHLGAMALADLEHPVAALREQGRVVDEYKALVQVGRSELRLDLLEHQCLLAEFHEDRGECERALDLLGDVLASIRLLLDGADDSPPPEDLARLSLAAAYQRACVVGNLGRDDEALAGFVETIAGYRAAIEGGQADLEGEDLRVRLAAATALHNLERHREALEHQDHVVQVVASRVANSEKVADPDLLDLLADALLDRARTHASCHRPAKAAKDRRDAQRRRRQARALEKLATSTPTPTSPTGRSRGR